MSEARLDWSTAQVKDGDLTVELDGEIAKGWKKSFKTTVKLLGGGEWGRVEFKKGEVRVAGVAPGSEEKLRHYLEGVVEQANASQSEPDEARADDAPEPKGPDAEMTARFRSFAEPSEPNAKDATNGHDAA